MVNLAVDIAVKTVSASGPKYSGAGSAIENALRQ
jgi:hypothetical protein